MMNGRTRTVSIFVLCASALVGTLAMTNAGFAWWGDGDNDQEQSAKPVVAHVCGSNMPDGIRSKPRPGFFDADQLPTNLEERTKLNFTKILVDSHGGYDSTENSYTIPQDGVYRIEFKSEISRSPLRTACLHVWFSSPSRGIPVETLYSVNSLPQSPAYDPYHTISAEAQNLPDGPKIAFQPKIVTDTYFKAGDVVYPMWIQFGNPQVDPVATLTAPNLCENHMFKLYRVQR